jgi:hypothetical protein
MSFRLSRRAVVSLVALAACLVVPANASAAAIISNGTVQLGVNDEGHLNTPGGSPSSGSGTDWVGVRYVPTNAEATAPGCLCEGWGAADAISGTSGYANIAADFGANNMQLVSFASTATTATSVVDIPSSLTPVLRVTHAYAPSAATPNLYEALVTIENTSLAGVDARYRRVMDWDVEPTFFSEYVTANIGTATALLYNSNDGFATANALGGPSDIGGFTGNFTDVGPFDHGALFDFGFGMLAPGQSVTFKILYGAAGTEADALGALAAAGAEAYSLGQTSTVDGPTLGTPNTFMFGFTGIGGDPIFGESWMTGGGNLALSDGTRVRHGLVLSCDADDAPHRLQVTWGKGSKFHLENITSSACSDDETIDPGSPASDFDAYTGAGTGRYNGVSGATAEWRFTDAGEPGVDDRVMLIVKDSGGATVLSVDGTLEGGNHQAHHTD